MAEKDQEHLRIRLDAKLLKRIDTARMKSGRTRTDEIEARLLETFTKSDLLAIAEIAVHNVLFKVDQIEKRRAEAAGQAPVDFYKALVEDARAELEDTK